MTNKTLIAIPKSLFEDSNLNYRGRMKRAEELAKQQLKNKGEHK